MRNESSDWREPSPDTKAQFLRLARMAVSNGTPTRLGTAPAREKEYKLKNGMRIGVVAVAEDAAGTLQPDDALCQVVAAWPEEKTFSARTIGLRKDGIVAGADVHVPFGADPAAFKALIARTHLEYRPDEDMLQAAVQGLRMSMLLG